MRFLVVLGLTATMAVVWPISTWAQTALCADPSQICASKISKGCLDRYGAGSISSAHAGCEIEIEAYRDCIAAAALKCDQGAATSAVAGPCTVEQEKRYWSLAERVKTCDGYQAFLDTCPRSGSARFASAIMKSMNCAAKVDQAGAGSVAAEPRAEPARASQPAADQNRPFAAQTELRRLGFYSGDLDGEWGPASTAALERFLRSSKLPGSGATVSAGVLEKLRSEPSPSAQVRAQRRARTQQAGRSSTDIEAIRSIDGEAYAAAKRNDYGGLYQRARQYRDGSGGKPKNARAAALMFKVACAGRIDAACVEWGTALRSGRGVAKNLAEAQTVLSKSCASHSATGCEMLALMISNNETTPDPRWSELRLYRFSCGKNRPMSCYNAGVQYERGKGVAKNLKTAESYYYKACQLNWRMACYNLGVFYEHKKGFRKSEEDALKYYKKACDLKHAIACNNYGWLLGNGSRSIRNRRLARTYYRKGCSLGAKMACRNLR